MAKLLEVIVTSLHDALEAEIGGADRLELVRSLESGGLTPSPDLVEEVVGAVSVPVRVMLRENATMSVGGPGEISSLRSHAKRLGQLPIDGLVFGFVKNGTLDLETTQELLGLATKCKATFHRAFEHVHEPLAAIQQLKSIPQIDRILTGGGNGTWQERRARLVEWQQASAPQIKILFGIGLCTSIFPELKEEPELLELHVGRAARVPATASGVVDRAQVAALKSALV